MTDEVMPLQELIDYITNHYSRVDVATYPPTETATAWFFSLDADKRQQTVQNLRDGTPGAVHEDRDRRRRHALNNRPHAGADGATCRQEGFGAAAACARS